EAGRRLSPAESPGRLGHRGRRRPGGYLFAARAGRRDGDCSPGKRGWMSVLVAPLALAAAAGLGAGVLHTWTGPDHLAALSPLAVSRGRRAWGLGVRWGIGHSAGALALAGLGLLARESLR